MACPSRISGFQAFRPTAPESKRSDREHRDEQLRCGPGDGRRRRRERAGQERHEFAPRFGIRVLRARESSRAKLFLPATSEKPKGTKNIYGGTIGGPIKRNKLFYFFSLETTDSRAVGGPFIGSSALLLSLPPTEYRGGNFSSTGTGIYDPLTGNVNGTGRTPFAFANCAGLTSTTDPRFASCNYIPANRLSPVAQRLLADLPAPQTAGNVNNYTSTPPFTSLFYKIDSKVTWTPTSRLNVNARISGLHDDMNSASLYPALNGREINPLSVGTDLNAKIFSYSLAATTTLTPIW